MDLRGPSEQGGPVDFAAADGGHNQRLLGTGGLHSARLDSELGFDSLKSLACDVTVAAGIQIWLADMKSHGTVFFAGNVEAHVHVLVDTH
jgi:hypothetical protein